MVNEVLKYITTTQILNMPKLTRAGAFPRAAHIDITKERTKKYTNAISHSGARMTSLYLTLFSGMGLPYRISKE
jgi:hypothetical protein